MAQLTHLDDAGTPRMVDVAAKPVTARRAVARAELELPPELRPLFAGGDWQGPKGSVAQTAVLAGIQAAKRTSELIPLCHLLPLDKVEVRVAVAKGRLLVDCEARATARTGVEMEALTGATVAALTVYDMVKAIAPGLVLGPVRLLEKTGGKADFSAPE